jgi:maltooligosyltrehalose trehalohydrolase
VWHDHLWHGSPLAAGILYELHVGTFTPAGTFEAIIDHLDHLVDLGITHLELMPIAEFTGDYGWGYDGVSLFAVRHQYGGPDGLKRLVDACHQRGLAVLLDVVYNHFGPVGNYANKFGPYHTDRHRTPWGDAVNFESSGSDEVRRFFCDNALMWMRDYHLDGLRLDAVHEFVDRSAEHFLEQLSSEVETLSSTLGRELSLIAESDLNDSRVVTPREAGGYGIDAQWSDDFHHALFTVLHPEDNKGYYQDFGSLAQLAKSLESVFVYDGVYSAYRGRRHGKPAGNLSAHHFIGYIQNHDQVGNRAVGDRIEQVVGMPRAMIAASTPFQYFAHHEDPDMARSVSEGRRREFSGFGWRSEDIPDPESKNTFLRSKLDWHEVHQGHHEQMLQWTTRLIHLRRSSTSLNDGDLHKTCVRFDEQQRWLRMERGAITLLCNLAPSPQDFDVSAELSLVLASRPLVECPRSAARLTLPPDTVVLLSHETETAPE